MSKIPKILPATTFSFCPDGHKLFRTIWTGRSTILMEPCRPLRTNNVWTRIFHGWNFPQSSASSTQQVANYRKLIGQKYDENCQRILICIFEGITTSIYGITSTWLVLHSTPNGLSNFNTTGLQLFPNLTWIWFHLSEHHYNLLNSAIQCPALQQM